MDPFVYHFSLSFVLFFFAFYCFGGWIFESIYCTAIEGQWQNRGFLFGPVCPIYGLGATTLTFIYHYGNPFSMLSLFFIAFFGSIILEYATSFILEKKFHARWWDYSHLPGNIHGRVSILTSIGFGLGGLFVLYISNPFCLKIMNKIPVFFMDFLSFFIVILFTIDATLTICSLTNFEQIVTGAQKTFNHRMELIVAYPKESLAHTKRIISERQIFFPFLGKSAVERVKTFHYKGISNEKISKLLKKIRRRNENTTC